MVTRIALILLLLTSQAFAQGAGCVGSIQAGGQLCDRSTTITSGGASQTALAANTHRIYCEIQAIGADLWVAIDQAAVANGAGSFYVPAPSLFRCPTNSPVGNINVLGATTGQKYTAMEFLR